MSEETGSEIIHRKVDIDDEKPSLQIAEAVADIEDKDATELPTMYECVDGMLTNLSSHPPSPEAQMEIKFCYNTYRVTIDQDGYAKFVNIE